MVYCDIPRHTVVGPIASFWCLLILISLQCSTQWTGCQSINRFSVAMHRVPGNVKKNEQAQSPAYMGETDYAVQLAGSGKLCFIKLCSLPHETAEDKIKSGGSTIFQVPQSSTDLTPEKVTIIYPLGFTSITHQSQRPYSFSSRFLKSADPQNILIHAFL